MFKEKWFGGEFNVRVCAHGGKIVDMIKMATKRIVFSIEFYNL